MSGRAIEMKTPDLQEKNWKIQGDKKQMERNQERSISSMNDVVKSMIERRSVKAYTDEMPSQELIDQIIEAGTYAANGMGMQSAIIVEVTDKATRD